MKHKPNKQHDARGASFKRIAKALRKRARIARSLSNDGRRMEDPRKEDQWYSVAIALENTAKELDAECATLRGMR